MLRFPGATPAVSASGATTNGIVWAINTHNYCTPQSGGCGPAVLHAYAATRSARELWNSTPIGTDTAGNAVKFTVPTIANGKVYIGTRGDNTGGAAGLDLGGRRAGRLRAEAATRTRAPARCDAQRRRHGAAGSVAGISSTA